MPAGKGGRAAKGGRGKGSSQSRKAVKTVKADDLEFLSSDEDDEPNTMKVLRSLLVHGAWIKRDGRGPREEGTTEK